MKADAIRVMFATLLLLLLVCTSASASRVIAIMGGRLCLVDLDSGTRTRISVELPLDERLSHVYPSETGFYLLTSRKPNDTVELRLYYVPDSCLLDCKIEPQHMPYNLVSISDIVCVQGHAFVRFTRYDALNQRAVCIYNGMPIDTLGSVIDVVSIFEPVDRQGRIDVIIALHKYLSRRQTSNGGDTPARSSQERKNVFQESQTELLIVSGSKHIDTIEIRSKELLLHDRQGFVLQWLRHCSEAMDGLIAVDLLLTEVRKDRKETGISFSALCLYDYKRKVMRMLPYSHDYLIQGGVVLLSES